MKSNHNLARKYVLLFSSIVALSTINSIVSVPSTQTFAVDSSFGVDPMLQTSHPPQYLLSVPFYVYEEFAWINGTIADLPIASVMRNHSFNGTNRFKHGDDYWFLQASLKHPMRTRSINEAKLFFVPMLLNQFDYYVNKKGRRLCVNERCNMELLNYTSEQIKASTAFQQYPEKHVIVRSHFLPVSDVWDENKRQRPGYAEFFLEMLPKMNAVIFEGIDFLHSIPPKKERYEYPSRYTLPAYKVGTACRNSLGAKKDIDVTMVGEVRFRHRQNLCSWLNRSSSISSYCGKGDRCPALAHAKLGFHVVGDTLGSQRLMDTILCGTVPVFTNLDQFKVQGTWIDWKQLSYYLPLNHKPEQRKSKKSAAQAKAIEQEFISGLEAILNDHEGYQRRLKTVLDHIPFFDLSTLYPFDTFMYLMQANIYPETRQSQSRWSAMILPPVLFSKPKQDFR